MNYQTRSLWGKLKGVMMILIRNQRKFQMKINIVELADRAGLEPERVRQLEDHHSVPTWNEVSKLCTACGMNRWALLLFALESAITPLWYLARQIRKLK